ncbi:MAG: hypothetical protein ACYC91_07365 [Solirubrobacteraceae bacterium]
MRARTLWLSIAALVLTLSGCGQGTAARVPELSRLPLADGASVIAQARRCDPGANAFCSLELVVAGPRYRSSDALLRSERRRLKTSGWAGANGDTGDERAADSPGHQLRVTFATASIDLRDIVQGWIHRSHPIQLALAHTLFWRVPALSMLFEIGPS